MIGSFFRTSERKMVSEGFADGILIANMQFVSEDIDDACRKIAKVSNVGGELISRRNY